MNSFHNYYNASFGCDPEFFFSKHGSVVGAEKIIPETGLQYNPEKKKFRIDGAYTVSGSSTQTSKIIVDGVQAELNPRPNTCRANLGNEIAACFHELYEKIKKDPTLNVNFSQLVNVSEEELASLSDQSRKFGCAPSHNTYTQKENTIKVNPEVYRFRSAGGHIHLGNLSKGITTQINTLVRVLDVVLGNTCVLIDKDPGAKERRSVYGKAGDYRLPPHGLEYRTLSNFWLRSYQLMSFVMGMARVAVNIVGNGETYYKALLDAVSEKDITTAINENDFDLAYKNYKKIESMLIGWTASYPDSFPISKSTHKQFLYFIKKDLDYWFPEDTLQHWIHMREGHGTGWENYALCKITSDMENRPTTDKRFPLTKNQLAEIISGNTSAKTTV